MRPMYFPLVRFVTIAGRFIMALQIWYGPQWPPLQCRLVQSSSCRRRLHAPWCWLKCHSALVDIEKPYWYGQVAFSDILFRCVRKLFGNFHFLCIAGRYQSFVLQQEKKKKHWQDTLQGLTQSSLFPVAGPQWLLLWHWLLSWHMLDVWHVTNMHGSVNKTRSSTLMSSNSPFCGIP